ncbi:MAG: cation transporting ATPase C-terminal domain-containing protein [Prosthecobacter sp.]
MPVVPLVKCSSAVQSSLSLDVLRNPWLIGGLVLGNVMHVLVIYTDTLNHIFHTVPIPLADFFLLGFIGSSVLWVEEIRKGMARWRMNESQIEIA